MADITITAASVRPLTGAIVRRGTAGTAGSVGDLVALQSDGYWDQCDADAVGTAQARGLVVGVNGQVGATTFAVGDTLDIVRYGPVAWGASMTPGGLVYASTTAGKGDQTAPATSGDFPFVVGYAEAAAILFVTPQAAVPTAN